MGLNNLQTGGTGGISPGGLRNLTEISAIPNSGIYRLTFDDADTDTTTSPPTALDVWNNNNDEEIQGATTGVTGANQTYNTAEAYDFDGTDDYVDLRNDFGLFDGSSDWSLSVWAQPDDLSTANDTIWTARGENEVNLQVDANGEMQFIWIDTNSDSNIITSGAISTGTWYNFIITWDADGDATLYLDGSSVGSLTSSAVSGTSDESRIGVQGTLDRHFDGSIDDPRLYNKTLTATEVSNLYNDGSI
jgi:hypothetical protein